MVELLIIILLICVLFGGWRWRSGAMTPNDPLFFILLVVILLCLAGFLTPYPYRYRWF